MHMGSLQQSVPFWESIGSSQLVLDWIRFGVPIRWKDGPVQNRVMRNARSSLEHADFIDTALAELLEAGAIRLSHERPAVVSPWGWSRSHIPRISFA